MGRPALAESRDTKAELLSAAFELVQKRGYHAFSYQDLAEKLAIKKASIHYYYPAKEDLGAGLLDAAVARFQGWQDRVRSQDLSPATQIEAYFDYFANLSAGGTKICPCGAMAAEWSTLPKRLQDGISRIMKNHREWLMSTLQAGRKAGQFNATGTVEEQAQFVYASVQGALQATRAQDNPACFRAITRQILASISKDGEKKRSG
jgi:TetR/AcrR family transcriptional repressor of nem operon